MPDPFEVNYVPDGDDWQVTVVGRGQRMTGKAPGLIAARDRADQLVEQMAPGEQFRTVVHLLNGDAVQFTTAYLTARLAKPTTTSATTPTPAPPTPPPVKPSPTPRPAPGPDDQVDGKPAVAATVPTPAPRADSEGSASKAGA